MMVCPKQSSHNATKVFMEAAQGGKRVKKKEYSPSQPLKTINCGHKHQGSLFFLDLDSLINYSCMELILPQFGISFGAKKWVIRRNVFFAMPRFWPLGLAHDMRTILGRGTVEWLMLIHLIIMSRFWPLELSHSVWIY